MPLPLAHFCSMLPLYVRGRRLFLSALAMYGFQDLEVVVRMLMDDPYSGGLHQVPHTYPFVLLFALIARIGGPTAALGVLLGGALHVTLDAVVHADVHPFLFTAWNPFFGLLTWSQVSWACYLIGAVALVLLAKECIRERRVRVDGLRPEGN